MDAGGGVKGTGLGHNKSEAVNSHPEVCRSFFSEVKGN